MKSKNLAVIDTKTGDIIPGKPIIQTHYFIPDPEMGLEVNTLPSVTVPDQAMSILEIIERYQNGLNFQGVKVPAYDSESPLQEILQGVDPRTLDLSEINQLANEAKEHTAETKRKLQDQERKKQNKAQEAQKPPKQLEIPTEPKKDQDNA